jgi:nucleotide-binding universal stress UspA family protein
MPKTRGPRFAHVLCPVDFSKHAASALRHACEVARRTGGRVTVVYVSDPLLDTAAAAAAYDVKALREKTMTELRAFIDRAEPSGVVVEQALASGHAAPAIAKVAAKLGADLLVMGSHGLTGPGKWLVGSTTERVLRTAKVPVLVVPALPSGKAAREKLQAWPGPRAVVPVDIDDHRPADVRSALDAVTALGAKPTLLYVVRPPQLPEWLRADPAKQAADRLAAAKKSLQALARQGGADADCDAVIGDPVEEIANVSARIGAQLIAMTLQQGSTLLGPRRGSITYRVVARGVASVLALPAR